MPLIERERKVEQVTLKAKIEQPLAEKLERYAAWMESSVDHVVAQAIEYVISKDKEFKVPIDAGDSTPEGSVAKRTRRAKATGA
jgi:hypothetical protein